MGRTGEQDYWAKGLMGGGGPHKTYRYTGHPSARIRGDWLGPTHHPPTFPPGALSP